MSKRITKVELYMSFAQLASERSTCARRHVGCVLTDGAGHVLATGYNGVPSKVPHCRTMRALVSQGDHPETVLRYQKTLELFCPGWNAAPGQDLEGCGAVHAEQNALLQCRDPDRIAVAYVTTSPCIHCAKLLLNTPCQHIICGEEYPDATRVRRIWTRSGRHWDLWTGVTPAGGPRK